MIALFFALSHLSTCPTADVPAPPLDSALIAEAAQASPEGQTPEGVHEAETQPKDELSLAPKAAEKKKGKARTVTLPVPVFLDDRKLNQSLTVMIPPELAPMQADLGDDTLAVDPQALIAILQPVVQPALLAHLSLDKPLTLDALRQTGLKVRFDYAGLRLLLNSAPADRRSNDIEMSGRGKLPAGAHSAIMSAPFSSFVNAIFTDSYNHVTTERQDYRIGLDGGLAYKDCLLEFFGRVTENAEHPFQRGAFRIVHDRPEQMQRVRLGDINPPTLGQLSAAEMGGIEVASNFQLNPYMPTDPIHNYKVNLQRPARLEVYVNTVLRNTFNVDAGPINLLDIPVDRGSNDVVIKITDDTGQESTFTIPFVQDYNLLTKGLSRYCFALACPSTEMNGQLRYNSKAPVLTAFWIAGLSDRLTAGPYLQANTWQQVLGSNGVFATPLGSLEFDLALSRTLHFAAGGFAKFTVQAYEKVGKSSLWPILRGSIALTSRRFAPLSPSAAPTPDNATKAAITVGGSLSLPSLWQLGFDSSFNLNRQGANNSTASFNCSRFWINGFRLTAEARGSTGLATEPAFSASIQLVWDTKVASSKHRLQLSQTAGLHTASPMTSFQWNYQPTQQTNGMRAQTVLRHLDGQNEIQATSNYRHQRFNASLNHQSTLVSGLANNTSSTTFTIGAALVSVGKVVTISHPISEGYCVISRKQRMRGQFLGINPTDNGSYQAYSDRFGAPVLPNLRAYSFNHVLLAAPRLKLGLDIGDPSYLVCPRYKAGCLIEVGTNATVILSCTLMTEDDKPLAFETGELLLDSPLPKQPHVFACNKRGKLSLDGLEPGTYQVRFYSGNYEPTEIVIPADAIGLFKPGITTVKRCEEL